MQLSVVIFTVQMPERSHFQTRLSFFIPQGFAKEALNPFNHEKAHSEVKHEFEMTQTLTFGAQFASDGCCCIII